LQIGVFWLLVDGIVGIIKNLRLAINLIVIALILILYQYWRINRMNDLDDTLGGSFIGKTILIGITYQDYKGNVTGRMQWFGTIKSYSNNKGIEVDLDGSDEPCCIPPFASAIRPAEPGVYRLKSSGKVIENPDFVTTWIAQDPDPNRK